MQGFNTFLLLTAFQMRNGLKVCAYSNWLTKSNQSFETVLNVNLNSCFFLIKSAVPLMKTNPGKWGRIINISSVHGLVASVKKSAYVAAKHGFSKQFGFQKKIEWFGVDKTGLNGLTKVVALETAEDTQITCNAIAPGFTEWTKFHECNSFFFSS